MGDQDNGKMELIKEYMFSTKARPTLTKQPSTSTSSSSDPFDLSCMISSRSMPTGVEDNGGQKERLLTTTLHDDHDGSSIGSTATTDSNNSVTSVTSQNDPDDIMTNETETCDKASPPASPLAAAPPLTAPPFPLRHNNKGNKTPSSSTRSCLIAVSGTHETTSFFEQHGNNHNTYLQQSIITSGSTSTMSTWPYHCSPATTLLPKEDAPPLFFNSSNNRNTIMYNRRNSHHNINDDNDHDQHDDDDDDDILGRLMSHPVTAQWMLTANHHDNNNNNSDTNNAGNCGWPMICVVGDTSSGKSSLLCNLSGIQLPTNHQLTTRCPILLHIARRRQRQRQPSSPHDNADDNDATMTTKTATIQIMWRTSKIQQSATTTTMCWKERTLSDQNWQEIPATILEAQDFILQQTKKQVAPDIVRVDVVYYYNDTKKADAVEEENEMKQEHHEYPYLTLLDLPGLIQTAAADESPTLVQEVQSLVRSYLLSPQVLILAVLSCTTDFHNAQVLAEIFSRNDGNNNLYGRTIPVLTKPDLMDPGAAEIALRDDLLLGGKQLIPRTTTTAAVNAGIQSSWSDDLATPTGNNRSNNNSNTGGSTTSTSNPFTFHMVKGRGQAALDRGDSIEQGLKDEAQFFETREPWKSIMNRSLFGTRHLQAKLARLQHEIVRKNTIPRLHVDIQERRHALQMELQDLIGGSGCCNSNSINMEMDAQNGMPLVVMLETPADRRRYYQQVCQTLVASLQASLSGKKQHHMTTTSSTLSRTTCTRSTRLVYRKQLQQFNNCMGTSSTVGQDDITNTMSSKSAVMTASAQLHEACNQFCQSVRQGSLATIKSVVEGAQVLVTAPPLSNNGSRSSSSLVSSGGGGVGALRQVRGEVVHLDESFACVDYIDPVDAQSDILFYNTRSTMFNNVAVEDVIEENDVWSDGNHVYIARCGGVYDTLQKIPLDRLRTDPSWLKEKIEQNRTDDLGCFLNADIFQSIVADFIDEDWRPSCLALLDRMREILRATVQRVVQETTGGTGRSSTRYPGLQKWLVQQCRKVAEDLIQQAYQQVESHLMMEKQHPYTQDHNLFQNMAQARHANLKRELEVALRLDHSEQQHVKLSNGKNTSSAMHNTSRVAIQNILDEVFERHSKKSVEDHMAEEMEIVLEAYGSIATRRVMDRTPMICWQVYRSITAAMQDALYCSVSDEALEKQILRQAPDFEKRYTQLTQELREWNQALEIVESVM